MCGDEPGRAERDQVARGVEHLGGRAVGRVQVPDRVGEDGGGPRVAGELGQPGRVGGGLVLQVVHDLDDGLAAQGAPAGQQPPRQVAAAGGDRLADVAGRAEQQDQPGRVLGDELGGDRGHVVVGRAGGPGRPAAAARRPRGSRGTGLGRAPRGRRGVGGGDQAAERRPALAADREQRHPADPGDLLLGSQQRQIDAEQGLDAGVGAGLHVLERAVEAIAVGQRERGHAQVGRPGGQRSRGRGAVAQRVRGRDVQVRERPGRGGERHQSSTRRSVQYLGRDVPAELVDAGRAARCPPTPQPARTPARAGPGPDWTPATSRG